MVIFRDIRGAVDRGKRGPLSRRVAHFLPPKLLCLKAVFPPFNADMLPSRSDLDPAATIKSIRCVGANCRVIFGKEGPSAGAFPFEGL
jgi:hypothetical protein